MPQMSPYNWLLMNLYFSSLMIITIKLTHFNTIKRTPSLPNFKSIKKFFMMKW